jgi:hypothetical protein
MAKSSVELVGLKTVVTNCQYEVVPLAQEPHEGAEVPLLSKHWPPAPVTVVPKVPAPSVHPTPPAVLRPEKVMEPEEVIPVAAAIAPVLFTWNCEVLPTLNKEAGVVVPMPTAPVAAFTMNLALAVELPPTTKS